MTDHRAALRSYAGSLHRSVSGAIIAHMPTETAGPAVRDATRTMAVGVLAHILGKMIRSADDHREKGGRPALVRLAHETIDATVIEADGRQEDPSP